MLTNTLQEDQQLFSPLPDSPKIFPESDSERLERNLEFMAFYDAAFTKNLSSLHTKEYSGVIEKPELSFFAIDHFMHLIAHKQAFSLAPYGQDQSDNNLFSIQLFHDIFDSFNPSLEESCRQNLAENPNFSYASVLAYAMTSDRATSLSFTDIPEEYCYGIMPQRIVSALNIKIPTAGDIVEAKSRYQIPTLVPVQK